MSTLGENHNRMYFAFIALVLKLHPVRKKKTKKEGEENSQRPVYNFQSWLDGKKTDLIVVFLNFSNNLY